MSTSLNNAWRKTASTLYKKPDDSKILGSVEVDITELQEYIAQKRKEGLKITLTHFFTLATARAIKEKLPELNTYIRRGNVRTHDKLTATVSVLLRANEMGSVKVEDIDQMNYATLVEFLQNKIVEARKGTENNTMQMKDRLAAIPWPFRNLAYWFIRKMIIDWGMSFGELSANNFGSYIVSNIGTLGLDNGYPALFPAANISFVLIMGGVKKKPLVINDEVKIRTVITLAAALDHRVVDASHAGILFKQYKRFVSQPEIFE
ncbi:2-oxo acid dehydrogenase subunit E2 [Jiulongibacter sediminis]|jgi:pyruvate/2-oxoglutarate dehydrogenase complex dihydrolipoamide acyltransferase (E2) component|uniref:2-oxo acid dehydrogenase subunit E2 n=1 Tax=Jiulongibacter sediminis TaxID=1605367 RepID=UPI0026ECC5B2|nr:2-oxo acid dehydrogenase subunit E2 [Jiulongibacter sediminis]